MKDAKRTSFTEFEKHEGSICNSINVDCPSCGCDRCTEIQHAGWKAALECVMRKGMHYYGNDFLTDMTELSRDIRIELGELNENGKAL